VAVTVDILPERAHPTSAAHTGNRFGLSRRGPSEFIANRRARLFIPYSRALLRIIVCDKIRSLHYIHANRNAAMAERKKWHWWDQRSRSQSRLFFSM